DARAPCGDKTLVEALLTPTRIYVRSLLALRERVEIKGLAHITGGGLTENIPRVLPKGLGVRLEASRWTRAPVFDWLERRGVAPAELHRTFNCGLGMVAVVAAQDADTAVRHLGEA